ncbi:MAG: Fic family protein [Candidatus Levybacteria bacterium]|nr:Fic family protein [Candidatus Levybacteria bacterium]
MLNLSFNLSTRLKEKLQTLSKLRQDILIIPLSPKAELIIQWNAKIDRTYSSLSLAGNPITKSEMTKLLTSPQYSDLLKTRIDKNKRDVIGYKIAQDYIDQNWLVANKSVSVKDILILYDIFCNGALRISMSKIQELLDYLQAYEESPIIQAGIVSLGIIKIHPFSEGNGRLARLLSLLFLYKNGFDVRRLVAPENIWIKERKIFEETAKMAQNTASITLWLEYFAESLSSQLKEVLERIKTGAHDSLGLSPDFWELNDRQKQIMSMLEEPGTTITNRKVQSQFKISQITASRDLSRLSSLGLIFTHGKGRSIYYSRI